MDTIMLEAKIREKKEKRSNFSKMIPSVLYGKDMESIMLWIDYKKFSRTLSKAGESTIIDLAVDGQKNPQKVLIYDIQNDPVSDMHTHIDFFRVKMDEEIEIEVEFEFVGEAPAVKEQGGVLIKNIDSVEVRCLPVDLPGSITVDISSLKTFEDYIYVKDLPVSDKVKIDLEGKTVVALVSPPRSEEELEELESKVEADISQVEGMEEETGEKETAGDEKEKQEQEQEQKPKETESKEKE